MPRRSPSRAEAGSQAPRAPLTLQVADRRPPLTGPDKEPGATSAAPVRPARTSHLARVQRATEVTYHGGGERVSTGQVIQVAGAGEDARAGVVVEVAHESMHGEAHTVDQPLKGGCVMRRLRP